MATPPKPLMNRHLDLTERLAGIQTKRHARFDAIEERLDKHEITDNQNFDNFEALIKADEDAVDEFGKQVNAQLGNGEAIAPKTEEKKGEGADAAKFQVAPDEVGKIEDALGSTAKSAA